MLDRCPSDSTWRSLDNVVPVEVLKIGTSMFERAGRAAKKEAESDYAMTMGFFSVPRTAMEFDPASALPFTGALYGAGWDHEGVPAPFASMWRGARSYSAMSAIYEATKVVVDDANTATASWGSVNRYVRASAKRELRRRQGRAKCGDDRGERAAAVTKASKVAAATWTSEVRERTRLH